MIRHNRVMRGGLRVGWMWCVVGVLWVYGGVAEASEKCSDALRRSREDGHLGMKKRGLEQLMKVVGVCRWGKLYAQAARFAADLYRYDQAVNLAAAAIGVAKTSEERSDYEESLASYRERLVEEAKKRFRSTRKDGTLHSGFKSIVGGARAIKIRRRVETSACHRGLTGTRALKVRCRASDPLDMRVMFALQKADIRDESRTLLRAVLEAAKPLLEQGQRLLVIGHTDQTGTREFNVWLSKERAKAVVEALVLLGLPRTHLSYAGMANDQPLASNRDAQGRARNRRVEFTLLTREAMN